MKFAIVGCGKMGRRHAAQYRGIPGTEVIACYDTSAEAARALAEECGAAVCADMKELLRMQPEGISVCTPPSYHVEAVCPALEHGVRVLCEKPLATRTTECRRIPRDAAMACAFKFRHLSGAAHLRDAIQSGRLGKILHVRGTAVSNLDMSASWFSSPLLAGGGVMLDNGVHLIDLCRYLLGEIDEVSAAFSGGTRGLKVEESAALQLRMACGASVHMFLSWEAPAPMPPLLEIYGSAGYARLGYEMELFGPGGKEPTLQIPADGVDIWKEVITNFVRYVEGRGTPSATLEDGFKAVAAAEAAYRSVETRRWERPAAF